MQHSWGATTQNKTCSRHTTAHAAHPTFIPCWPAAALHEAFKSHELVFQHRMRRTHCLPSIAFFLGAGVGA